MFTKYLSSKLILTFVFFAVMPLMSHAFERSRVAEAPEQISPLLNGMFIPDVVLKTSFGKDIKLLDIVENRPSIILFYRGGWCPYCSRQMAGLIEVEQQILNLGYQIIVISPDSPNRLNAQQTQSEFDVVRLSDPTMQATRAFGLAYFLPDTDAERYQSLGAELVTVEGTTRRALPVPAAFVVDTTGLIKFQYANPNYKVRIEPQLLYYAARVAK